MPIFLKCPSKIEVLIENIQNSNTYHPSKIFSKKQHFLHASPSLRVAHRVVGKYQFMLFILSFNFSISATKLSNDTDSP